MTDDCVRAALAALPDATWNLTGHFVSAREPVGELVIAAVYEPGRADQALFEVQRADPVVYCSREMLDSLSAISGANPRWSATFDGFRLRIAAVNGEFEYLVPGYLTPALDDDDAFAMDCVRAYRSDN